MDNKTIIFELLYKNHENSYNINQIARILGISVGSSFKILKKFEQEDYVNVNKKNNALLYQINLNNKAKEFYERVQEEENRKSKKKTKVICTIGTSSDNPATIRKMIDNGMDVARLVFNHDENILKKAIQDIRQASDDIPILLDICDSKPDKNCIKFALKNDLDFISITAKSAVDIHYMNKLLGYSDIRQVIGDKIKVIVKINKGSLRNYKELIEESYGIIIDRSELADTKIEILPKLQKEIVDECNKHGKPVIIAGRILDSMISGKYPIQSEVYDISNSVFDGASCLMLSEETATGDYPIETIKILSNVVKNAESGKIKVYDFENLNYDLTNFMGKTASELEKILHIDALLIITSGGYSARMISSRRLKCRIIAATSRKKIFRQLHLLWGIEPLYTEANTEDISNNDKKEVIIKALKKGFIGKREQIAIIASIFHSKYKRINVLEIHNVSEFLDYLNRKKELKLKMQEVK